MLRTKMMGRWGDREIRRWGDREMGRQNDSWQNVVGSRQKKGRWGRWRRWGNREMG